MKDGYFLNVNSDIIGGYFSSEQIDLLSIVRCKKDIDLIDFVVKCDQLNHKYSRIKLKELLSLGLESAKRIVFEDYQNTLVDHNSSKERAIVNSLINSGLDEEEVTYIVKNLLNKDNYIEEIKNYIKEKHGDEAEWIFERNHHFVSLERDQNKDPNLYDEFVILNDRLSSFNSMTLGSGKIYDVMNVLTDRKTRKFDFYHMRRDLDFAYSNNKHVRFHSLLVKGCEKLFDGKSKKEILSIMTEYVTASIDFINEYNRNHYYIENGEKVPVINAVDLFNEIVSFDKDENGNYYNIWEKKYKISIDDLKDVFKYALDNKDPKVSYIYNEPMLEMEDRRNKVLSVLDEIDNKMPRLIDTLGTQMHIDLRTSDQMIRSCFDKFKEIQDKGKKIQITEFDMSISKKDLDLVVGPYAKFSPEEIYDYKTQRIDSISKIINDSKVKLDGISYWSLTDRIDFNMERLIKESKLPYIQTAFGGLFPTCDARKIDIFNIDGPSKIIN